jgi:hypothetical protein
MTVKYAYGYFEVIEYDDTLHNNLYDDLYDDLPELISFDDTEYIYDYDYDYTYTYDYTYSYFE